MKQKFRMITLSFLLVMQSFLSFTPTILAENSDESVEEIVETIVDADEDEKAEIEGGEEATHSDEKVEFGENEEIGDKEGTFPVEEEEAVDETDENSDSNLEEESTEPEELPSLIQPSNFATMSFDPVMPETVIVSTTEFKVGGVEVNLTEPITVQNNQKAEFRFNLELTAGHNYGPGTTLSYKLPDIFTNIAFPQGTEFGTVGELSKSGNIITITFNENITTVTEGGNIGTPLEPGAHFYIEATFNNTSDNLKETISLPGQENIALNFTPLNGTPITKENGVAKPSNQNSEYIEWTVKVNTDLKASGTATFIDRLSANNGSGHMFDQSSVSIYELKLNPNGDVVSRNIVTDYTPSFNGDNTQMEIALDGTKAYEITYRTFPADPGNNESVTYRNEATYNDHSAPIKSVNVGYGTPLNKSGSINSNTLETTWMIQYNHNKRTILQANAKLNDTWSTTGGSSHSAISQVMVADSLEVHDSNGHEVTGYTITPDVDGQGFEIEFDHNVTDAYTITYKTKPAVDTYITSNMTVTNTVTRHDINLTKNDSVTYNKSTYMLNKSAGTINYENKTIDWTITANKAGYTLPGNTTFTDTFTNQNMDLKEETLIVEVGGTKLVEGVGYTLTNHGKSGFDITLQNETSSQIVISYTTDYDIRDVGSNDRKFHNRVEINNSGLPVAPFATAERSVTSEQTANGKKDGKYNYATKKFEWEVELNFNYNTLNNAIFEDVLPSTQTIDVDSIEVVKGTLNANGIFQPVETVSVTNTSTEPNKIVFSLGEISQPYKVTYSSYDTDGVFPETSGKVKITNKATLKNGATENASWTKTVWVNYTDHLIKKRGSQINQTAGIRWNFEFNYAQSNLSNIVITDTVGKDGDGNPNQLIKEDSFKVYTVALNGKSDSASFNAGVNNSANRTEISNFALDVNVQEGTFELRLPDGDNAYYIEYETVYMGDNNSTVTNEVQVNYLSTDGNQAANQFSISNFKYGNAANTVKVPFVVVKTDGATGEPMENVEFTLYSEFLPGVPLLSDVTNAQGILDFNIKLTEGKYTLKETTVDGYVNPGDIEFFLNRNSVLNSGPYAGKQVVEIENLKTGATVCNEFTLIMKDVDGEVRQGVSIKFVNKKTGNSETKLTNGNGEITFDRDELPAGSYEVFEMDGSNAINDLGEINVRYDGNCEAIVIQPDPSCAFFTITIEDMNKNPRANVTVTLEHKTDQTVAKITQTTDANGTFTIPSTTKPGIYKVYEGNQYLGEITVTYKNNCSNTIIEAPKCEVFSLIIKDVDGTPRDAGVTIIIKEKGSTIEKARGTTDLDGKVVFYDLEPGEYEVYEDGESVPFAEFASNINCSADVQPKPTCENFTVIIRDVDGKRFEENVAITLVGNGIERTSLTNVNGEVLYSSEDLPAGTYEVFEDSVKLGDMTVSYKGGCSVEVQQNPECNEFILFVTNTDGKRFNQGETITLKDKARVVADQSGTTNADSKVIFNSNDLPAGTYEVYYGSEKLGEITVSYKGNCGASLLHLPLEDVGGKDNLLKKIIEEKQNNNKIKDIKIKKKGEDSSLLDENGGFSTDGLDPNEKHEFTVIIEVEDENGNRHELIVGKIIVEFDQNGEPKFELIDPYGVIRDADTGKVIEGVKVTLYYCGSSGTGQVDLPRLDWFGPNWNENPQMSILVPQWSDLTGDYATYAWMVYPYQTYCIVAEKEGYDVYRSPQIVVEEDIIKHDFEMTKKRSPQGGGAPGGGGGTPGGGGGTPDDSNPGGGTPGNSTPPPIGSNPGGNTPDEIPEVSNPGTGDLEEGTPPSDFDQDGTGFQEGSNEDGSTPGSGDTLGDDQQTGNNANKGTLDTSNKTNTETDGSLLPQTGEERNWALLVVGIFTMILGASLILFRRKTVA